MLKIGDEVYLSDDGIESWVVLGASKLSTIDTNPISTKGVITDIEIIGGVIDILGFSVEWSNGYWNCYDEEDLIKVRQEKPVVIGYKRVWSDGSVGQVIMDKLAVSKVVAQKRSGICIHENGKQKFRPVY